MARLCGRASERRPCREIVLGAVRQDGRVLQWLGYAAEHLRGDRAVRLCSKPSGTVAGCWIMRQNQDGFFMYELTELSKEHYCVSVRANGSKTKWQRTQDIWNDMRQRSAS
jgi:hypothetical protein